MLETLNPLQLLGIALGVIFAALIGLNFLWNKQVRPARIKKAQPTATFGNILSRALRLMFKEDAYGSAKLKTQSKALKAIASWRSLYIVLTVVSIAALLLGNLMVSGIAFGLLIMLAYGRCHSVFSQRNKVLFRMFEVANTQFRYGRGADLNPWGYVNVREWESLVIPGHTIVSFPAAWRADDPHKQQEFQRHFSGVVTSDNEWSYSWDGAKGIVECKPVAHLPTMAEYPGSADKKWSEIPLGVGIDGEISWDLAQYPHMLVCGTTGGGKSVLQRNIIFHVLQHSDDIKFLGVDLKRVELSAFAKYEDAVLGIATTLEDGVEVMRYGRDEMMRRYEEMENLGVTHFNDLPEKMPALLIMVDEAFMFMSPEGVKTDEGKARDELHGEAVTIIGEIARLGRAAGVHLLLATQRPDASVIRGEIKANLLARYAAGRMQSTPSLMVLDSDGATRVPDIRGRGVVSFNGQEEYIQGYFAKQDWIDRWLSGELAEDAQAEEEPTPKKSKKPKKFGKKNASMEDAEDAGMLPIPDFTDGMIDDAALPKRENAEEGSSAPVAVSLPVPQKEALFAAEGLDFEDSEEQDVAMPVAPAEPVRTAVAFDDDDEEDENFTPVVPAGRQPMERPVFSEKPKNETRFEWDDDLDEVFADLPYNTGAVDTQQRRQQVTAPSRPATVPGSPPQARPVEKPAEPAFPASVASQRPARPASLPARPNRPSLPQRPQPPQH